MSNQQEDSSSLVQANSGSQDVGLQKMVAQMVKQAIEAERAKSTAPVGTSQAGSHSVSENGMFRAEEGLTNPLGVVRRLRQITDVHTLVQCFAVYIGVMSHKYPEAVPELLVYVILIVRSSREFAELTWARYDTDNRCHAANSGNRQWSWINPSMYAVHSTGRAQATTPRCELCASVFHLAKDCPFFTKTEMEKTLEAVLSACTSRAGGSVTPANPGSTDCESNEVCQKWNDERCNYQWCRYHHVCHAGERIR
ncbi:hypothetical protein EMCRGX_G009230 [Ephydatia muelleri]